MISPEDTLRALRDIVTKFMMHEIEGEKEAFELMVEELERGGYGSIENVTEIANDDES